jgi:two-component system C4-dicarboxylate transport response regulator DctD
MSVHILIVDDDLAIRDAMHEFIQTSGYEASVASSAEEALDLLGRQHPGGRDHRHSCCPAWTVWN